MKLIKTVILFYLIYTAYTIYILLVSDYNPMHALLGLIIMWLVIVLYSIGYLSFRNYDNQLKLENVNKVVYNKRFTLFNINNWKKSYYFMAALFNWIAVIMSAKFYTGRGFFRVISGIAGGSNAYVEYQRYFASSGLGYFSLLKIPHVFMLTLETIILYFGIAGITQSKGKITITQILFIVSIICSHLYFGVARGTNYETYSVFILLAYCVLNRTKSNRKINYKAIGVVGVLGIIMVAVYFTVVMDRGVSMTSLTLCPEIHLQSDSIVASMFPRLTVIAGAMFSYLGYGIYEIGVAFYNIIFDSLQCMIGVIFPGGIKILAGSALPTLLSKEINMGYRWCPDLIIYVGKLGVPLFGCFAVILGRFMHKLEYKKLSKVLIDVVKIIVFIEFLSLPVGNFLSASTPNELFVLFVLFCIFISKYNVRLSWR